MNLFKSELFNSVMLQEIQPRPLRSHHTPAFGRRYGRRGATTTPNPIPIASLALAGTIEQIGDTCVLLDYDQAA